MAQRSESRDKFTYPLPSKQAIMKEKLHNGTTPYNLRFFTLTCCAPMRLR